MTINIKQTRGYARPKAALKAKMGASNPIYQHLLFSSRDVVHYFDDFLGDALNADLNAVANSGGTGAADFAITVASGGTMVGNPGTTDNGSCSWASSAQWYGDQNCGMEVRLKLSQITAIHWEVGFVQGVPGSNTGAINDIDTPTAYGTDMAVVGMDTDQTLKTAAFVTEGSTASQDPTKVNCGTFAPTADTYFTIGVQLNGNNARCFVNGTEYAIPIAAAGSVEGGTALLPFIYVQNRGTAATTCSVDYVDVWQDRA